MDDRSRALGIVFLGILACGALLVMGALAYVGQEIPPSIAAAFGVAVGSLSGLLPPNRGGNGT